MLKNYISISSSCSLTFEDTGGEIYHHRIGYSKSIHQNQESSHVLSSSTIVTTQQVHRNEMNTGTATEQIVVGGKNSSPKNILESEKRIRREIANSNERRRMQSINAGFQNLRALLPRHEGEKLSKVSMFCTTVQILIEIVNREISIVS